MTEEAFDDIARDWFATAKHPKLGRPFTRLRLPAAAELLDFLRANGFKSSSSPAAAST